MNQLKKLALGAAFLAAALTPARAQNLDLGRLSIRGRVGPDFALGDSVLRENSHIGPLVGGSANLQLQDNVALDLAYDRLDLGRAAIADMFTAGLALRPVAGGAGTLIPYALAAAGFGRPNGDADFTHLGLKFGVGADRMLTDTVSLGAALYYFYVSGGGEPFSVHALAPAVTFGYYFGR